MPDSSSPRLFTIAPGQHFLKTLAEALIDDAQRAQLFAGRALEDILLLLPTRRAVREISGIFLHLAQAHGRAAILLPDISTLGDITETGYESAMLGELSGAALDVPPQIAPQERHFQMMNMIVRWADKAGQKLDTGRISALARELETLLDNAQNEQVDLSGLSTLVPDELAHNWQQTLEHLSIITQSWPLYLDSQKRLDPTARRNLLMARLADSWRQTPPPQAVIAAGSTGSIRATAKLLQVVAHLPEGCVVLPGLDTDMPAHAHEQLRHDAAHPQAALAALLHDMKLSTEDVADWPGNHPAPPRTREIMTALNPVPLTANWAARLGENSASAEAGEADSPRLADMSGIDLLEAPDPRAEAGAIALAMRGVLETPDKTAALVTPDRRLARRVAVELRRWNIEVDDSAGRALATTPLAQFMRLVNDMVASNFAPVPLLAVLKHPLACLGRTRGALLGDVRQLERTYLRGPRPTGGLAGLRALADADGDAGSAAGALIAELGKAVQTLTDMPDPAPLDMRLDALEAACRILLARPDAHAESVLEADPHGADIADFFDNLREYAGLCVAIPHHDWPALFDLWVARPVVRDNPTGDTRLFIWGLLEARLMQADLMVLGGLNEGDWPKLPETGPWLSRPMRAELGLSAPERRIGQAAHDFVQAASAPQVLLTRAGKIDGTPTVAARWLRRIETLCGKLPRHQGNRLLAMWSQLDTPNGPSRPVARAQYTPPVPARPAQLSVTQIETLIRDPYALYARKILGLREWEAVDGPLLANHRGTFLHAIFENLMRENQRDFVENMPAALLDTAEKIAREMPGGETVLDFWRARLAALADWFSAYERDRAHRASQIWVEATGDLCWDIEGAPFTLTAKADRIDRREDASYRIIDYKTGQPPTQIAIKNHIAVQMTLEAAMLERGAFAAAGVRAGPVSDLEYLHLSGRYPPGRAHAVKLEDGLFDAALASVEKLIAAYRAPDKAYISQARPNLINFESRYDHLARVDEWRANMLGSEET
jgi:ATP-dependent helicase/nuclease subunit B